jgi:hypothetical protein
MLKVAMTCFMLPIIGQSGSAHADWAVLSAELGVTLVGAVSADAASGEPKGASISATCIKGSADKGLMTFAFTNTPSAEKIDMVPTVPAAYRLIIDGAEFARVSSGPGKSTTPEGTLRYAFIWSVAVVNAISNAQKEIKIVFDDDPASIVMSARGSTKAVQSFLQQCGSSKDVVKADKDVAPTAQNKAEYVVSVQLYNGLCHKEVPQNVIAAHNTWINEVTPNQLTAAIASTKAVATEVGVDTWCQKMTEIFNER